jgi:hypothetical protein
MTGLGGKEALTFTVRNKEEKKRSMQNYRLHSYFMM